MKLQYPLQKEDSASYSAPELFELLANEPTGHYLLGSNDFWHGGVHFTDTREETAHFKNIPVRAVADGTIVAYRINEKYIPFVYENDKKQICENHLYSSSLCLIRHEYESPAPAQKMQNPQANPTNKKGWEGRLVELTDGRNARNTHATSDGDSTCTFRVTLPKGTRLKIITNYAADDNFYTAQIASFPGKKTSETFDNAKVPGSKHTLNVGDEVFFHGFDKSGNPVFNDASNTMPDWGETRTLAVKANHRGYTFLLLSLPEEYIHIPAGTQLTPTHMATNTTRHGKVFMQVTADVPLEIHKENICTLKEHPAGTPFYAAVTDEFGNTETAETTDAQGNKQQTPVVVNDTRNRLTFYSLYMHLLPFEAYGKDPHEGKSFVHSNIGNATAGSVKNLDERSSPIDAKTDAAGNNIIVTAGVPKDTVYELVSLSVTTDAKGVEFYQAYQVDAAGKRLNAQPVWIKKRHVAVHPMPSTAKQHPHHWKHDNTIQCTAIEDVKAYIIQNDHTHANKLTLVEQDELEAGGTYTYHYANDLITFKKLVVAGAEKDTPLIKITLQSGTGKNQRLRSPRQLYLRQEEITPQNTKETFTPKKLDEVVPCNIPVKAGDALGYLGLYETPNFGDGSKNSKHQLHFEILTNDDRRINDFLDNKANVTTGRKYLKVNKRTYVMFGESQNKMGNVPPAANSLPKPYFNQTPNLVTDWVLPLSETPLGKKTDDNSEWYRLPVRNLYGCTLAEGQYGWVRKGVDNEELTQYDLRKLGFTVIEETDENTNGDMFVNADKVKTQGKVEIKDFFQTILNEIDKLGKQDGKITREEIQAAYKKENEDLADRLQKIIGYHPTEWRQDNNINVIEIVANSIKADIDSGDNEDEKAKLAQIRNDDEAVVREFADEGEDTLKFLKQEQQRMENLVFWNDVPEVKDTPKVWHFHPVAFIEHISSRIHPIIYIDGSTIELEFLYLYDGTKIGENDYAEAAKKLGCEVNAIKAVAAVETGAYGAYFDHENGSDLVPSILYERHIFSRRTSRVYDNTHPVISNKVNGGYSADVTKRYPKLLKAYELNKKAALESASWGIFQIMGFNHQAAGYSSVESFVFDISRAEKYHLQAFVNFILADATLHKAIKNKDWLTFANSYNGTGHKAYDVAMGNKYNALNK